MRVEVDVDCRDVRERLDAYLDRELPPAESAAVRDHVATCVECRGRLAAREALGTLTRQAPYYTAPAELRHRLAQSRTRSRRAPGWLIMAAAVLCVALAGSLLVMKLAPAPHAGGAVADVVVDSHVRSLMGEHLFDVRSTDQHTVKPWFLGKLDFSPPVQDLAGIGFPLVGGRIEYLAGHSAAALVYTRGQHTINVFIWPDSSTGANVVDARSMRGFHVRHWSKAGMSFWAVSDLNEAELDEFVRALQK